MTIVVVGGGGREHAIIKKLKQKPTVETVYCLPGNGGIAADAVCRLEQGGKFDISVAEHARIRRSALFVFRYEGGENAFFEFLTHIYGNVRDA